MAREYRAGGPSRLVQRLFLFIGIPIVSMCLVFALLVLFGPRKSASAPVALGAPSVFVENSTTIAQPVRLQIGVIDVDTLVKPVGLTAEGDMAVDNSIDTTAWYQFGPKPGEKGSAVIAGHYGWTGAVGSIFNNLHTLKKGDTVTTYDDHGSPLQFIVREIRTYHPEDDATEVFSSHDGKAHLNLITCEGSWDNKLKTYSERLVVFTDKL